MRRLATLLAFSLAVSAPVPGHAGWTKQKDAQWTGRSSLECVRCGTDRVLCWDEINRTGTNALIDIASDYTVTLRTPGSLGGYGHSSITAAGCNASGTRIYAFGAANEGWYADTPFSSWNSIGASQTLAGEVNPGGTQSGPPQYAVSFQSGFSPNRVYARYLTDTSGTNGGGYNNVNISSGCGLSASLGSNEIYGSGCWRTATVFDALLGCRDIYFYYGHKASFGNDYAPVSIALTGLISGGYNGGNGEMRQALSCSSDGATSITGIRSVGGKTLVIRRGAVTREDEVATPLVGTYSGTAFEGATGRYLISTTGALWKDQDAAAPADMSGATYDVTLDGGDTVAALSRAPDWTKPMALTTAGDVFTWASESVARPRRSTLSGSLGGTMRGGL